jgi:hypothetical protein
LYTSILKSLYSIMFIDDSLGNDGRWQLIGRHCFSSRPCYKKVQIFFFNVFALQVSTLTSQYFPIPRVPESVLQVKFSAICQVLLNIMAAKVDSKSTALLKSVSEYSCLDVHCKLLHSKFLLSWFSWSHVWQQL